MYYPQSRTLLLFLLLIVPYLTTFSFSCTPGNYVHDNGDAGLAMMESFNADVSGNLFENNKYGVRFSVGCASNIFYNNVITGSAK